MQSFLSVRFVRTVGTYVLPILLVAGVLGANLQSAFAADTGGKYPGTISTNSESSFNDENWVNSGNISADDGTTTFITTDNFDNNDNSFVLRTTNFSAGVPASATINGILVEVERDVDNGSARDSLVQLTKNGTVRVGTNKANTATNWSNSTTLVSYGGSSDLWGTTWTDAEINASTFGVHFAAQAYSNNTDIEADFIRITVYYTLPAPDLTVVKTNNLGGGNAQTGTPFNWVSTITNGGNATATFTNGQEIFKDNLPSTGATYGAVADVNGGGTTGTVDCSVASNDLTCVANGTVTVPPSGTITVTLAVTPTIGGTLSNPRSGGICKVDSALVGVIAESNEGNNTCANAVSVTQTNPSLGGSCGLDIALALDTSTSIDNTELGQLKTAFLGFVSTLLPSTPTMFSLIRFDDDASTVQAFTGNVATISAAISGTDGSGFTNWQAGLNQANSTFDPRADKQNVIIFASDGNPTVSTGPDTDLNDAIAVANAIKASGTRIITLGIGADVSQANLEAISSADAYYNAANFTDAAAALEEIAVDLCGGTVTVKKLIDADGNLATTNDRTNGAGWTFNTNVDAPDFSTPASGVTAADGTFNFAIDLGANDLATLDVSEVVQGGYSALSASCVADDVVIGTGTDAVNNLTIGTNDIVSCTFINSNAGKIVVDKVTIPAADAQSFSFDAGGGNYADFALTDGGAPNEQTLASGNYTLSETLPSGWTQTSAVCVSSLGDTETPVNLELDAGETITCTVTNTKLGSITVEKQTLPNGNTEDFTFSGALGAVLSDGETSSATGLVPGVYAVTETVPGEWDLTGLTCSDGNSTGDIATKTATFNLEAGENITCTFTNTKRGSITVKKDVVNPDGGAVLDAHGFTALIDGANGQPLSEETDALFNNLVPGNYTISESPDADYVLADAELVSVAPGEDVTITLTNKQKKATLTLVKVLPNDNGGTATEDNFTPSLDGNAAVWGAQNVNPDTYTLSETNLPGYTPSGWTCQTDSVPVPMTEITLGSNGVATCTITNDDQPGTLIVKKIVDNGDGGTKVVTDFSFSVNAAAAVSFEADGQNDLTVNAGTYTITEPAVDGYATSYENCTNVAVANGETETCVITNNDIAPTLTVIKTVVNDNGGNAVVSDFPLFVNGNPVVSGATTTLSANTLYTVTETNLPGYTAGAWGGDCTLDGTITLLPGEEKVCTITNDDQQAYLIVDKTVVNDNGGSAVANDFALTVDGNAVSDGALVPVNPGAHTAGETNLPGYTAGVWGTDCSANGNVSIALGETKTCTITNDDQQAYITVTKVVTNNNGGSALPNDFALTLEGSPVSSGVAVPVNPGTYTAAETNLPGYTFVGFSGDCDLTGDVTVALGETKTCTLTNDDQQAYLIVDKTVVNDNGGNAVADDFLLTVDGNATTDGALVAVNPGNHTAGETTLPGYIAGTWGGDCDANGSVSIALGQTKTCTITNDDDAPSITLTKIVVNDNGGTAGVNDFGLTIGATEVSSGQTLPVLANTAIALNEAGLTGYSFVSITGDAKCPSVLGGTVTLNEGEDISCTVTNNDNAPSLTLVKNVVNDNGAAAEAEDWTLSASGPTPLSGAGGATSDASFDAGTYVLSETGGPVGYTASSWSCSNNDNDGTIEIALGEKVTCTITNDDVQPLLTVTKVVVNHGGNAAVSDFPLFVSATPVTSGTQNGFNVGSYTVSETASADYTATFSGDCASDGSVTLSAGDVKSCSITNEEKPAKVVVTKTVVNNGGDLEAGDFGPFLVGDTEVVLEEETTLDSGTYQVTETESEDYTVTFGGNCTSTGLITLTPGETVTCEITNTEKPATLIVNKIVINDNGGTVLDENVPLFVDGNAVVDEAENIFTSGTHVVSETTQSGYTATFGGDCDENGNVTLTPGETKTCTITNDDQPGLLIVHKTLVQNNGGTEAIDDFSFTVGGGPAIGFNANGINQMLVDAGTYDVAEVAYDGYSTTYQNCSDVVVANGGTADCYITNDDIAPKLKLQKVVVGGPLTANKWKLTATGPTTIFGNGGVDSQNAIPNFSAGTYVLTESSTNPGAVHYTTDGVWSCIGSGNEITLGLGDEVECEITNTYVPPGTIVVEKQTVPDGATEVFDFDSSFTDPYTLSDGQSTTTAGLVPGIYSVAEAAEELWDTDVVCSDGSSPDRIDLQSGETVTCVFTNTRHTGTIELVKVWEGTADDAVLSIGTTVGGDEVDAENAFGAGATTGANTVPTGTYYVSESLENEERYDSSLSCVDEDGKVSVLEDGAVVVEKDDAVVCTYTNTRKQGTLTVEKVLPNNDGGTASPDSFSFSVNGGTPIAFEADGENVLVLDTGTYSIVETDPGTGYSVSYGNSQTDSLDCTNLTVTADGNTTCTITNDDKNGTLIVKKVIVGNENELPTAFGYSVNGATAVSFDADGQTEVSVSAGVYSVTEPANTNYTTTYENCSNVTVSLGETETCVITNTYIPDGTITVVKVVEGNEEYQPSDFTLYVDQTEVVSGAANTFEPGAHTVHELGILGFTPTFSGDCVADVDNEGRLDQVADLEAKRNALQAAIDADPSDPSNPDRLDLIADINAKIVALLGSLSATVDLSSNENAVCTITNTYVPPTGTLIVRKVVGGESEESPSVFAFMVNGGAAVAFESDGENVLTDMTPATYTVTEEVAEGYVTTYENCEDIVLSSGETEICTITNTPREIVDLCPNLQGDQEVVPEGYELVDGICVPIDIVENTCPVPDALEDDSDETINLAPGSEKDLQEILDEDTSFTLSALLDQKQFQVWNVNENSKVVIDAQFVNKFAGNKQVFGYYADGDFSTFVPVFKTGSVAGYESVPLSSAGPFVIETGEMNTIGFAIKTYAGDSFAGDRATENALNSGNDQVVVYNPASNTYVLAFEDVVDGDSDYNDLVVTVELSCAELCTPETIVRTVVSDTETTANDSASVLLSYIHEAWTALIADASWIWSEEPLANAEGEVTETFTRSFAVEGNPVGATLEIAADNAYEVLINGNPVMPECKDETEYNYRADGQDTCEIPGAQLIQGQNTITFIVKNFAQEGGTPTSNPAGLLYKLTIESQTSCEEEPTDVCPNLEGDQEVVPEGYVLAEGMCVPDDEDLPQCSDGVDNSDEEDVLVDSQDPGCHSDGDPSDEDDSYDPSDDDETDEGSSVEDMCPNIAGTQESIPEGYKIDSEGECEKGKGGGGGGGRRRGGNGGEVLGAATTCGPLLTQFLHKDWNNDPEEVKKLQMFLNKFVNAGLPESGFFGPSTFEWVKTFQMNYGSDVLTPWVGFPASGITGENTPTGFVYQTTKWKINNIWCPGSEAFPKELI